MSIQNRRPLKLPFRVRRNFAIRDWTSIGMRRTRVSSLKGEPRTTAQLAGRNSNSSQGEESRIVGFDAPGSCPPPNADPPSDENWSEWLWLGLIMLAIAAAAIVHVMQ
jgi:hypothetical protein